MEIIDKNDYVRTDKGHIGEYKDFINNYFEVIIKHSKNIIDIIEERRLCKWKRDIRN